MKTRRTIQIGIDLGTTVSAVGWWSLDEAETGASGTSVGAGGRRRRRRRPPATDRADGPSNDARQDTTWEGTDAGDQ